LIYSILGYDTGYFGLKLSEFWRNLLHPSPGKRNVIGKTMYIIRRRNNRDQQQEGEYKTVALTRLAETAIKKENLFV
jgi:hypothetical protein